MKRIDQRNDLKTRTYNLRLTKQQAAEFDAFLSSRKIGIVQFVVESAGLTPSRPRGRMATVKNIDSDCN